MIEAKPLVAINARLNPELTGGISTFLGALVSALGNLDDSEDSYVLVGYSGNADWLESVKGDNQKIVLDDIIRKNRIFQPTNKERSWLRNVLSPALKPVKTALKSELAPDSNQADGSFPYSVPVSDGFWESLDCDVVHFPFQHYVICGKPTIYNPHDLQQLHYPEYFTAEDIAWRESVYPAGCHFARTVVTASQWVKDDIVRNYGTDPDKIQVIPWAPPTQFYSQSNEHELAVVSKNLALPDRFILYPAVTWPHKNHLRLLEAIVLLRDHHGLVVPLVCTGSSAGFHREVLDSYIQENDLAKQVQFVGFLPDNDLRAVYRLCTAVVVPTLFEAASGPVFEAWQEQKPVACSTVTSLPEQAGDAALLFDPHSTQAIADAIKSLFENDVLCQAFSEKGRQRLSDFCWDRTARAYRAVYRKAAHIELTDEDRMLLSWDWMKNPKRACND